MSIPDFTSVPKDEIVTKKTGKWEETLAKILECPSDKVLKFDILGQNPSTFEQGLRSAARRQRIKLCFKFGEDINSVYVWRRE